MIYKLRKKFIAICVLSLVFVFLIVLALLFWITSLQTERSLDRHADMILQNDGRFPDFNENKPGIGKPPLPDGFNRESPFTTRYFTVRYDSADDSLFINTQQIASVSAEEAEAYAETVLQAGDERGWIGDYRYKIRKTEIGSTIVFVSGVQEKERNQSFMLGAVSVFFACALVVTFLIVLISKRAVKPTAQSYEKQKQFITDANHELKTPLTLIRANLDILESELGENEWISDIREETLSMNELVNRMVQLARMDEDGSALQMAEFDLSAAVSDTVSLFETAVKNAQKALTSDIDQGISYKGDEAGLRQVTSILMDNALKYCDAGGEIVVSLRGRRHPILTVENSYAAIDALDLDRLFDRFYRADPARTHGTGFGIGLSMAKSIVEKQKGSISAYRTQDKRIGFRIKL